MHNVATGLGCDYIVHYLEKESAMHIENQEGNLKKVLGLGDVIGIAVANVVGAGVLVLTGIAIGMTGTGVILAYMASAAFTLIKITPMALMSSALPTTGGMYRYSSRLLSPKLAFFWMLMTIVVHVGISNLALTFAMYFQGLIPGISIKWSAALALTVCYIANLCGIKKVAVVAKYMVLVLLTALGLFIAYGLPAVDYARVLAPLNMLPHGWAGFFSAVALVSFATNGAQFIAEIGGEMKNPGRDIPLAMYTATIGVGLLYGVIATVASGVLPLTQVADKPLTAVAKAILPAPLFLFFMVGGALVVLIIHLLVIFATVTKGLLIACQDGWLPKRLGAVNRRFGTPHWLLTLMFVVGMMPVLSGMTITTIAALGSGVGFFTYLIPFVACTQLPKRFPEAYAKARFKLKPMAINIIVAIAIVLSVGQGYILLMRLNLALRIIVAVYISASAFYIYLIGKTVKYQEIRASTGFHPEETAGKMPVTEKGAVAQS